MANPKQRRASADEGQSVMGWSTRARVLTSIVIVWHLLAVVVAPWSRPQPASELSIKVAQWFRPYMNATYLNQGYRFFAPNPPRASNIVRYEITLPSGELHRGEFPDRDRHWPRLLYHRHFMITSQIVEECVRTPDRIVPARMPPEFYRLASDEEKNIHRQERRLYLEHLARSAAPMTSIANHLLEKHEGTRVKLFLARHEVPARTDVARGLELTDESLYFVQEIGELVKGSQWKWSEEIRGVSESILP